METFSFDGPRRIWLLIIEVGMPQGKYRVISFTQQMGIGASGSWQTSVSAIAKCNTPGVPYCVPNELVCAEIGRFLCLPVPPAGIIHAPGRTPSDWFASLDFNLSGSALPPVDPDRCWSELPGLSVGLLLFDILVVNSDRHRGNLSVDHLVKPAQMSVFDHSHALFGHEAGKGIERLSDLQERLGVSGGAHTRGNRHCLLDTVTSDAGFGGWLDRISELPDFFVNEVCRECVGLGISDAESLKAVEFLKFRRDNLRRIIERHRAEFRKISQWSLVP